MFAGAGASVAVDREHYPTTVDFYDRLPEEVRDHDLLKYIRAWRSSRGETGPLDVEVVLWALDGLNSFLEGLRIAADFPIYCLRHDYLTELTARRQARPNSSVGQVIQHYPSLAPEMERLRTEINDRVHEFYAEPPSAAQLEASWMPLLLGLTKLGYGLELATTNYDLVLEKALDQLKLPEGPATGRADDYPYRYLDLDTWRNPLRPAGLLTKLHGSVDWSYARDGRIRVGNPEPRADRRQAIIYPGFKGTPEQEEFALFHAYFAQAVASAECLVFVGFAFRDSYLNDILKARTPPTAKVIIVNPADGLAALPFDLGRVVYIRAGFDRASVDEVLARLSASSPTGPVPQPPGPIGGLSSP